MTDVTAQLDDLPAPVAGRARQAAVGCLALAFGLSVAAWVIVLRDGEIPAGALPPMPVLAAAAPAASKPSPAPGPSPARDSAVLLDPSVPLGFAAAPLERSAPLAAAFEIRPAAVPVVVAVAAEPPPVLPSAAPPAVAAPAAAPPVPPVPAAVIADAPEAVPLPLPRPADLDLAPSPGPVRAFGQRMRPRLAAQAPAPADNRSFFEKLFGIAQPPGPALAYAAPEDGLLRRAPSAPWSAPAVADNQTAVYNIASHTVTLPNGDRLEAHSGLADRLDDPRRVSDRNRGPTPPHVYDLSLREALFHGVQALRLNPVGGGGVYGRTGLLAHTYMLGPNGDSNGCVSFRNYEAFLRAFRNGEVRRLLVVTGQS